MKKVDKFHLP